MHTMFLMALHLVKKNGNKFASKHYTLILKKKVKMLQCCCTCNLIRKFFNRKNFVYLIFLNETNLRPI